MVEPSLLVIAALLVAAFAVYLVVSKVIKTTFKVVLFLAIVVALYYFVFRKFF